MVIPIGPPEAQQPVLAEQDLCGKFTMKEIMPVLFSRLEEADEGRISRVMTTIAFRKLS
jgi:hypothetical protein